MYMISLTSQAKYEPQSEAAGIRDVGSQYLLRLGPVSLEILLGKLAIFILEISTRCRKGFRHSQAFQNVPVE